MKPTRASVYFTIACGGVSIFTIVTVIPLITINIKSNDGEIQFQPNTGIPNFQASDKAYETVYKEISNNLKEGESANNLKDSLDNLTPNDWKWLVSSSGSVSFNEIKNDINSGNNIKEHDKEFKKPTITTNGDDVIVKFDSKINIDFKSAYINSSLKELAKEAKDKNLSDAEVERRVQEINNNYENISKNWVFWDDDKNTLTITCQKQHSNFQAIYDAFDKFYKMIATKFDEKISVHDEISALELFEFLSNESNKEPSNIKSLFETSGATSATKIYNYYKDSPANQPGWMTTSSNDNNINGIKIDASDNKNVVITFNDANIIAPSEDNFNVARSYYLAQKAGETIKSGQTWTDKLQTQEIENFNKKFKSLEGKVIWNESNKTLIIKCNTITEPIDNIQAIYNAFNDFYKVIYENVGKNKISATGLFKLLNDSSSSNKIYDSLTKLSNATRIEEIYKHYKETPTDQPEWMVTKPNGNNINSNNGIKIDASDNKNVVITFNDVNIIAPSKDNFKVAYSYYLVQKAVNENWTPEQYKTEWSKLDFDSKFASLESIFKWDNIYKTLTIKCSSNFDKKQDAIDDIQATYNAFNDFYAKIADGIKNKISATSLVKMLKDNSPNKIDSNLLTNKSSSATLKEIYNYYKDSPTNQPGWKTTESNGNNVIENGIKIDTTNDNKNVVITFQNSNIIEYNQNNYENAKYYYLAQKAGEITKSGKEWTNELETQESKNFYEMFKWLVGKVIWNDNNKTLTITCISITNPIVDFQAIYNAFNDFYKVIYENVGKNNISATGLFKLLNDSSSSNKIYDSLTKTSTPTTIEEIYKYYKNPTGNPEWMTTKSNGNNVDDNNGIKIDNKNVVIKFNNTNIITPCKNNFEIACSYYLAKTAANENWTPEQFEQHKTEYENIFESYNKIFSWNNEDRTLTIICSSNFDKKQDAIDDIQATYNAFNDFYAKIAVGIQNNISATGLVKLLKDNSSSKIDPNSLVKKSSSATLKEIYNYYKDLPADQPEWMATNSNGNNVDDNNGIKIDNKNVVITFQNSNIIAPNKNNYENAKYYYLAQKAGETIKSGKEWTNELQTQESNNFDEMFRSLAEKVIWDNNKTLTIRCESNFDIKNDLVENAYALYMAYTTGYTTIINWINNQKMSPERLKLELENQQGFIINYLTSTSESVSLTTIYKKTDLSWYKRKDSGNKITNITLDEKNKSVVVTFEKDNIRNWENAFIYGPYFNYVKRVADGYLENSESNQKTYIFDEINKQYKIASNIFKIDNNQLIINCAQDCINDETAIPNAYAMVKAYDIYSQIISCVVDNKYSAEKLKKEYIEKNTGNINEKLFFISDSISFNQAKRDLEEIKTNPSIPKPPMGDNLPAWYKTKSPFTDSVSKVPEWIKKVEIVNITENNNTTKGVNITFENKIYNWKDIFAYAMKFLGLYYYYTRIGDDSTNQVFVEGVWKNVQEKAKQANEIFQWNDYLKILTIKCKS